MPKELRELLNSITAKKAEAQNLVNENKIEEAQNMIAEIKEMQNKANAMIELEGIEDFVPEEAGEMTPQGTKMSVKNAFVECFKAMARRKQAPAEAMEVLDAVTNMTDGEDEDGGLTVPQDIQTKVKELRRSLDALETIVNVEPVATLKGSRVIEKDSDSTPWDNVDEEADFPDVQGPQFENIPYQVKKKGGILKVTKELLADTAENIMGFIQKWIAKKSKVTRNFLILKTIKESFGNAVAITDIDDIKNIFNETLDPALLDGSMVLTNQTGFNYLDKIKTTDGDYVLQVDATDKTKRLLFGRYPIMVVSNKTLGNDTTTTPGKTIVPIYFGNFKEGITLFDREYMSIETSDQAGDMWKKDQIGVKVRERLDCKAVDTEAIVIGKIEIQ